jgi:hypothetical protein
MLYRNVGGIRATKLIMPALVALPVALMPWVVARAQVPDGPTTPDHLPIARKIVALLKREMDVSGIAGKEVTVKDLLQRVMDSMTKLNGGRDILIVVNTASVKDKQGISLDSYLAKRLKLPGAPRKLTFNEVLRLAVALLPGKDATYIVRREFIEITQRVTPFPSTFDERITITNRSLSQALKEVSEKTAIPIEFSHPVVEKVKSPVSVTIERDADLLAALRNLTKKAGLTLVVTDGELVVVPVLRVQVDVKGRLLVPGRKPMAEPKLIRAFFRDQFREMQGQTDKDKSKRFDPLLILLCDRNTALLDLEPLIRMATEAGFQKWQLRVQVKRPGQSAWPRPGRAEFLH